jgi:hypothetical protein
MHWTGTSRVELVTTNATFPTRWYAQFVPVLPVIGFCDAGSSNAYFHHLAIHPPYINPCIRELGCRTPGLSPPALATVVEINKRTIATVNMSPIRNCFMGYFFS